MRIGDAVGYAESIAFTFLVLLTAPALIAHELTHYAPAWIMGREPKIEWYPAPTVTYLTGKHDWLIRFAPMITGCYLAATYLFAWGVPAYDPLYLLGMWYWAAYTYPSRTDRNEVTVGYRVPEWWAGVPELSDVDATAEE